MRTTPTVPPRHSLSPVQSLARQLMAWRARRRPGQRIPEELWKAAADLARLHGLSPMATALKLINLPASELARFFEQVAFTAMVRNGDGHLKNYGVLYRSAADVRLAPLFDCVTTTVYKYQRFEGGPELVDHTMALKLFVGRNRSKQYPSAAELIDFGRHVCGVAHPAPVLQKIAQAMTETLAQCANDPRIGRALHGQIQAAWDGGMALAGGAALGT